MSYHFFDYKPAVQFINDADNVGSYYSDSQESCDIDFPDCVTPQAEPTPTSPPKLKPKSRVQQEDQTEENPKPCFDINDPLRYCLEIGEINEDEYERWKIVKQTSPITRTARALDFGPGYNSDSDTDNNDEIICHTHASASASSSATSIIYGYGYNSCFPYDPWFPNPDPTPNKEYTELATNPNHMLSQFVVFENEIPFHHESPLSRLNSAFHLKLVWENFNTGCKIMGTHILQYFWQYNSLEIYEALQELNALSAKCINISTRILNEDVPEYHTTPLEMLENTFETIGRMSRCIAEDFNTSSIVNYVGEFIHALYVELRFMELVEAKLEQLMDEEHHRTDFKTDTMLERI
mgnify:CR=1 FL=1